jgi:serine/threonine protein phosphatase PrpC
VLFNVVGSAEMRVEVGPALQLAVYDTVLLASDGLFDNLYTDEIVDTIRSGPLAAAADRLVARVQARMQRQGAAHQPCKPDDLTVVLFRPRRRR